jgi:hypothetical protein
VVQALDFIARVAAAREGGNVTAAEMRKTKPPVEDMAGKWSLDDPSTR